MWRKRASMLARCLLALLVLPFIAAVVTIILCIAAMVGVLRGVYD